MRILWQDVRHSFRLLANNRGFAAAGIVSLAIGLGATTSIFSVVKGVLLQPLPYGDPDRLVDISIVVPPREGSPGREGGMDARSLSAWREAAHTLEDVAAYRRKSFLLTGHERPERVEGATASASLFTVLGVAPAVGRTFYRGEDASGADRVVVLSHGLWQRRFQGNREIVGDTVRIDGAAYRVVGVMPRGFFFPDKDVELWKPLDRAPSGFKAGSISIEYFPAVGRLEDGVGLEEAGQEAQAILSRLARSGGEGALSVETDARLRLVPLHKRMVRGVESALKTLSGAVGLVLLIAWVNVGTLLLAQSTSREREFEIRRAVGGGRIRLLRQVLTESTVLSVLGGVGGVLVAIWIERILPLTATEFPRLDQVRVDAGVYIFTFVLACVTGLLLGLVVSLRISATAETAPARSGTSGRPWATRPMGLFVVVEVSLAVVLMVGSGILLRSFRDLLNVKLGYEPAGVMTTELELEPGRYGHLGWSGAPLDELLARLNGHPGVDAAGVVSVPPFPRSYSLVSVEIEGLPPDRRLAVPQLTSPGYLKAVGMRLLEGRWLSPKEHAGRAPVVVVNESFVARYLAEQPPLGRRLQVGSQTLEIVGVVEDARLLGLESDPRPEMFTGYHLAGAILGSGVETLTLAIRTASEATGLVSFLRAAMRDVDPHVPIQDVRTIEARLSDSVARPRFYTTALSLFAGIALLLSCAGLYGVLSYSVAARTREIGIRTSLGARGLQIVGMVLKEGMVLVLAGLAAGLVAAMAAARVLTRLWEGVSPLDPAAYSGAVLLLVTVGALASIIPAYRARSVEPTEALRRE